MKYKDFLNLFSAKVLSLGYPSLSDYIALKYSGQNEPFISLPRCPGLLSNELTPPDLDTTYVDKEENDIDKKPKTMEKKEKSLEGRILKNERVEKNVEVSKVAAAAAAAALQVDEAEDTDFGGGSSNQSSHGYDQLLLLRESMNTHNEMEKCLNSVVASIMT